MVHFGDLAEFVNVYAANLSVTGMFIRAHQQCPAGTSLHFELKLSDDSALIQGDGEVVWIRPEDESADRPAGMGVRFIEIDEDSREIITLIVDRHTRRGGDRFDLSNEGSAL